MKLLHGVPDVRGWRDTTSGTLGFVPTMGYLHAGHLALVARARAECGAVLASIFVNPMQFGPGEDLARYPRDLERDLALLADGRCDAVFVPSVGEMYPPGFDTAVEPGAVSRPLEGERRPGHFRGVATVVARLFGIVQPQRAYFGEKDAQQLAVIRRMTADLALPVEVVGCPTVREPDGLALSSRNSYLGPEERRAATVLHRALQAARLAWEAGIRETAVLEGRLAEVLGSEPLARVDYAVAVDPDTFAARSSAGPALLALAVFVGRARLIDNLRLDP